MTSQALHRLSRLFGLILVLALLLLPATALAQGTTPPSGEGYYYTVQRGDTWSTVSRATGLSVARLKALNPHAVHPKDWLWVGDKLWIPKASQAKPTGTGYWYTVKKGDSWRTVSEATGVSIAALRRANPSAAADRNQWLYIGQRLWIPGASGATAPAPEATSAPTVAAAAEASAERPTPTPTATATPAEPTASPTPTATKAEPTATSTAAVAAAKPTATPTARAAAAAAAGPACPPGFADYDDAIADYLAGPGQNVAGLEAWLTGCGVIDDEMGSVTEADIQRPGSKDVIAAIRATPADDPEPRGVLLVYHRQPTGYVLARKAEGFGPVQLLKAEDINDDGKIDLVWIDRTCGASTCFSTLFVESWNGEAYQDWIDGEPTMADAEYRFEETVPRGAGSEILAHGGVINSVGAGPQRAWTETYISPEGGPYELFQKTYDSSSCLYHRILDANELFDAWTSQGFAPAIKAYQAAIDDKTLKACGTMTNELATLRDFARYRLAVSLISNGEAKKVSPIRAQMTTPALAGVTDAFLKSYNTSRSIVQACRDTTKYAVTNPASWQFLADWGYANPTFTAQDLCPLG